VSRGRPTADRLRDRAKGATGAWRRCGSRRARPTCWLREPASLSKEVEALVAELSRLRAPIQQSRAAIRRALVAPPPRTKDRETVRADAVRRQHLHRADHALQDAAAWRSAAVAEEWLARHAAWGSRGAAALAAVVLATDRFRPELARTLALGLTSYGSVLGLALSYTEDGRPASRELLHGVARSIGLEPPCSCAPVSSSTTSPPPTTPSRSCHSPGCLARASRSSWRCPIRRRCHGCQSRPSMSSTPATTMAPANGWAASSEDLPHRVEECTDGD